MRTTPPEDTKTSQIECFQWSKNTSRGSDLSPESKRFTEVRNAFQLGTSESTNPEQGLFKDQELNLVPDQNAGQVPESLKKG